MKTFSHQITEQARALQRRVGFNAHSWLRTLLTHLAVIGVFGVFLPLQKGADFLDPVILGAYACFSVVFAGPASASGFEESDPADGGATARILVCVLYGELLALAMVFIGVGTVYASRHVYVGPDLSSFAICAIFGLTLSVAVSTLAVWMSLKYSPSAARGMVRVIFVLLLIGFFFRSRRLPALAPWGAGIALAVATGAFLRLREAVSARAPK